MNNYRLVTDKDFKLCYPEKSVRDTFEKRGIKVYIDDSIPDKPVIHLTSRDEEP